LVPDLGFLSGNPRCERSGKSCSASSPIETWYSDCVCPWVWNGKSSKCPVGDELSSIVAKAAVQYLKNRPDFPEIAGSHDVVDNFTAAIKDSPVEPADIEALLASYAELMSLQSNNSIAALMKNYLLVSISQNFLRL